MFQSIRNIFNLGVKELIGLLRDPLMVFLIFYSFTLSIYIDTSSEKDTISDAAIAIVDEDNSQVSQRIIDAFLPPYFHKPDTISRPEIDPALDRGDYTFVVVIPANFQRDVIAGRRPSIQLNVDATRMSQAFTGSGYVQQIAMAECVKFLAQGKEYAVTKPPAEIVVRNRFNPNLTTSWFGGVNELINNITMLAIILTGAALIRERERGTLEHLMVMPITSFEIMVSKIWSMALIVLFASAISLQMVVKWWLGVPTTGSFWLFMSGVALHLFAVTSLGIFLACFAQNMPQFGLLMILVLMPMQMLSGGTTPLESMPAAVRTIMQAAPTTQFVAFSQSILFRDAGFNVVWEPFLKLFIIGCVLFMVSLSRFRKMIAS